MEYEREREGERERKREERRDEGGGRERGETSYASACQRVEGGGHRMRQREATSSEKKVKRRGALKKVGEILRESTAPHDDDDDDDDDDGENGEQRRERERAATRRIVPHGAARGEGKEGEVAWHAGRREGRRKQSFPEKSQADTTHTVGAAGAGEEGHKIGACEVWVRVVRMCVYSRPRRSSLGSCILCPGPPLMAYT